MWNKKIVTIDQFFFNDYQNIKYHTTKRWNNYIEWIHAKYTFKLWWGVKVFGKCVMEKHYSCNILKYIMW